MKRLFIILSLLLPLASFAATDEARLLRFPSVGGDKLAFSYAGDLYVTSINGGEAKKLTSNVGFDSFSRITPDGKTIVFTGQYDGNTEVYAIPVEGGSPKRLTYSATISRDDIGDRMGPNNIVMCFTPDGKNVVYRSRWYAFSSLKGRLFKVNIENPSVPEELPTAEGGFCSYSPDGKYFAFNRMFREFRTWKYYKGGQADDIWINEVGTNSLQKITDNDNQDIFPMWIGDEIYYMSDRDRTMNLFCYNVKTKQTTKVTNFTEYDCKFPSYSQDYVVFENGGYIYKYDVKARKCDKVTITLHNDAVYARPEMMELSARSFAISPEGERIIVEARGDIFSIPASSGATYNITNSSTSHEKDVTWSPDGKTIAYFSDASGEYQLYTAPAEDMRAAKARTSFKNGYPTGLTWSPDSKKLYFSTEKNDIYSFDPASGKLDRILVSKLNGYRGITVSPDGAWLALTEENGSGQNVIYLYNVANGEIHPVTSKWYSSGSPLFSQDGKYLYFTSARTFSSQNAGVEWDAMLRMESSAFILPLAKSTPNPTALKSDEYKAVVAPAAPASAPAAKPGAAQVDKSVKVTVDFDGIENRATKLPISGRFVYAPEGKLLYTAGGGYPGPGGPGGPGGQQGGAGVQVLDLSTMTSSPASFKGNVVAMNSVTGKALVRDGKDYKVTSLTGGRGSDKTVPMSGLKAMVNHTEEWTQIFNESWRITRDYFYVRNMHGRDWQHVHDKYAEMLPYVQHRQDLTYLIGEMLGELNVGHAYITTGEAPAIKKVPVGLLGAKFSKTSKGTYKIEKIFQGENWNEATRSPLTEPGSEAKVGEYIVAIDGVSTAPLVDIYQALVGRAGDVVSLTVAETADGKNARTIYVKTIENEQQLAYYEWVHNNIEKVDKMSNGQVGYIHIPDMGDPGLEMFTKLYYTQLDKKALIIDDRMNGGGNVSPIILARLAKEPYRMSMYTNGHTQPVPNEAFYGPKVVMIDKYSSSDGDLFPYSFQKLGLGTIVGVRSWGGIVGISGSKPFLDGQDMRTPFFTSYSVDTGEWIVEGHGVEPDVYVDNNPYDEYAGYDQQLEKAVQIAMEQMKDYKPLPGIPADPIR
ncbi:MAG: PD40 domain-containing protein [Bacteroidales bacterium]|nr:PD40 domain-containing protein [Bacteroidales bacterium]